MAINTSTSLRRTFAVESIQVTEANMEEVAAWCRGTIVSEGDTRFIKVVVDKAVTEKQTKAYIGDHVLFAGKGFMIYTDTAFKRTFEPLVVPSNNNVFADNAKLLERELDDPDLVIKASSGSANPGGAHGH